MKFIWPWSSAPIEPPKIEPAQIIEIRPVYDAEVTFMMKNGESFVRVFRASEGRQRINSFINWSGEYNFRCMMNEAVAETFLLVSDNGDYRRQSDIDGVTVKRIKRDIEVLSYAPGTIMPAGKIA